MHYFKIFNSYLDKYVTVTFNIHENNFEITHGSISRLVLECAYLSIIESCIGRCRHSNQLNEGIQSHNHLCITHGCNLKVQAVLRIRHITTASLPPQVGT